MTAALERTVAELIAALNRFVRVRQQPKEGGDERGE